MLRLALFLLLLGIFGIGLSGCRAEVGTNTSPQIQPA
jgi:hypothetical protein